MKTKLAISLLFMWLGTILHAQDFKEDYRRLQDNFLHLQNFYCEVKVLMYEQLSSAKPEQVLTSIVKKQGNNYLCVTGGNITLSNRNCNLQINDQERQILYTRKSKKHTEEVSAEAWTAILDSALKQRNDSIVFGGIQGEQKKYTIYTAKAPIVRTEMFLDQQTQTIVKLVYYYKPDIRANMEKVVIEYGRISLSPSFSEAEFSEKNYITYSGKTVKPVNTTYRIIVTNPGQED